MEKGRSWMPAEKEGKPHGLDLAPIFILNCSQLGYSLSAVHLLHVSLYWTPIPSPHQLGRSLHFSGMWIRESLSKWKAWYDAPHEESSQTRAIVMQESVLLSPSTIVSWRSCFPGSGSCGQSLTGSTSPWETNTLQSWMLFYSRGAPHLVQPHGHQI